MTSAIHIDAPDDTWQGIEIAEGIEPAPVQSTVTAFEAGAWVARGNWHATTARQLAAIGVRRGIGNRSDTIGVVRVPEPLVRQLRLLAQAPETGAVSALVVEIAAWLGRHSHWCLDVTKGRGFHFDSRPGAQANTTRDRRTGRHVGLHLDHWDALALDARAGAQNRLCINLGTGTRALQILPVTAAVIARSTGDLRQPMETFLRKSAHRRVLRIPLLPADAYIAPTENIPHDGCAPGMEPDLTFSYRGHIEPFGAARATVFS